MKLELKKISVWAAVKVSFVLNLIFGFIMGIFYAIFLLLIASLPIGRMGEDYSGTFSAFAGIAAIFLPFLFAFFVGVIYTIIVAISVIAYNLIVKLTGGLEFEFKQVVEIVPLSASAGFSQPPSGGEQQSTI
ncbi:MAG: hypothetical protein E4G91_06555 [Candidatus Zixiibacteriota bacterium]|nr:MAG: hypothetical protein E4G91_06555 [candidate division Zixibacteria bacterium]